MVSRCTNLKELDLSFTGVTNLSITYIITHLRDTLEKLDVSQTRIDDVKLLELRSMPRLQVLNCRFMECDSLKIELPYLNVNEESLKIALPWKFYQSRNGFWEIQAKQLQLLDDII